VYTFHMKKMFLDTEETLSHLDSGIIGSNLIILDECESTNNILKAQFRSHPTNGHIIAAAKQLNGRGRGENEFYSPEGGIYFSFSLQNESSINEGLLTIAAGVSVQEAVHEACNLEAKIKWVNDIYLDGKKIAGILTEKLDDGYICGIGLNVFRYAESDYPPVAGALSDSMEMDAIDINFLFATIINRLNQNLFVRGRDEVLDVCRKHSLVIGNAVRIKYKGRELEGTAIGIDQAGALIVQSGMETLAVSSGVIQMLSWPDD